MADIITEPARLPLHFPDPRAEERARAEEFRLLTPEARRLSTSFSLSRSSFCPDFSTTSSTVASSSISSPSYANGLKNT